jgi:cellulose synthase/poly-beta-1,6-N-acetylglucosamine synthase-like glycosyltransferase
MTAETSSRWNVLRGSDPEAAPDLLPSFGPGGRPKPENSARLLRIHTFAVVTLIFGFAYIGWRWADTVNLGIWYIAIPLIVAETHNVFGLLLFTMALWDIDRSPPWHAVDQTNLRVAVLIPTFNEPEEVLLPTIAGALAMQPAHETWVLDDGKRPEVHKLATEMGAHYLTRPDNSHYKAGNLNHAMDFIKADIFAIFDADHVAGPDFLRHTLCYFDDPRIAVVQTPQDFYNTDSFEHERQTEQAMFHEEAVFYRVIAPGKNMWGGAFWCGTCSLVRYAAIQDVGGVATDSVTEDIHTTIRMNRKGWKAVYHNEVLARGLAPADALQYMVQRNRWAVGAMQVMRIENPLFGRGLSFGQRLSFATTILAWFDSWRTLTFILLPAAVIFTGSSPIDAPGRLYVPMFLLAFISQFLLLRLLARGYYPPILSLVFEMLRLPAVLPATFAMLNPKKRRAFKVTAKAAAQDHRKVRPPQLLVFLMSISAVSIVWFIVTILGWSPADYAENTPAVIGSFIFACVNFWLLSVAVKRVRAAQYAGNRRAATRFEVFLRGELGGEACIVRDLSFTGARIDSGAAKLERGQEVSLVIRAGDTAHRLESEVIRVRDASGRRDVALRFLHGQRGTVGALALIVLNGGALQRPSPRRREVTRGVRPVAA